MAASHGAAIQALDLLARQEGLEPPTPGLEGPCSIQLSYCRVMFERPEPVRAQHFTLLRACGGPRTIPRRLFLADIRMRGHP